MQPLPHHYSVAAISSGEGDVPLSSDRLPSLPSAPPAEYGGPGDRWSPETLLVAAVADCFVLTFRGVARASKLSWSEIRCDVEGTLDRVEGVTQFTEFLVRASLKVPAETSEALARRVLQRAEDSCLIVNSLRGTSLLVMSVEVNPQREAVCTAD
jgi:organic hydroperoxide reductase OsmC/OhrA